MRPLNGLARSSLPRSCAGWALFAVLFWGGTLGVLGADAPACTCAVAREADGWCDAHAVGYVAAIPIRSKLVFEAVDAHGHEIVPSWFQCDECQKALASDGFCTRDSFGFVNKLTYFSRLTYELARGERVARAKITCRTCRKNAQSQGWCERCKLGRIGPVAIRERASYEAAARAADLLRAASETALRCDWCGVAVLTSTECPMCRIHYKGGKPAAPSQGAATR